jgi:drug/metabolite transporter (DMT)-like permease
MTSAGTELVATTRRPGTAAVATAGIVASAIVVFAGNYHLPAGENGGLSAALVTGALCAVVAAILFGLVVPRVRRTGRATLVLGVLTVLTLAVFWAGLTPILAAATLAVASRSAVRSRRDTVVCVVAGVAAVLTLVWTLANSHIF